jgi:DNA-directed RNA polymerase specialized sigma24 family protein
MMHPLVRDLYRRVLLVGRDYPAGLDYVKVTWKKAFRNPDNCPSKASQQELNKAVARGRHMVREMEGVIQLKKYRAMKKRYGQSADDPAIQQAMQRLEGQEGTAGEHR